MQYPTIPISEVQHESTAPIININDNNSIELDKIIDKMAYGNGQPSESILSTPSSANRSVIPGWLGLPVPLTPYNCDVMDRTLADWSRLLNSACAIISTLNMGLYQRGSMAEVGSVLHHTRHLANRLEILASHYHSLALRPNPNLPPRLVLRDWHVFWNCIGVSNVFQGLLQLTYMPALFIVCDHIQQMSARNWTTTEALSIILEVLQLLTDIMDQFGTFFNYVGLENFVCITGSSTLACQLQGCIITGTLDEWVANHIPESPALATPSARIFEYVPDDNPASELLASDLPLAGPDPEQKAMYTQLLQQAFGHIKVRSPHGYLGSLCLRVTTPGPPFQEKIPSESDPGGNKPAKWHLVWMGIWDMAQCTFDMTMEALEASQLPVVMSLDIFGDQMFRSLTSDRLAWLFWKR
ncbi:hypothetical protein CMQ_5332 [Grosmannia clavigera kw1407]|uniref:Uncharacterized protein n=1 Tax=Grosmannia clavigera (strain kw1407 / UAMH 11150) TaxID=655863 RepID=F0XBJ7_GROCL|nr:uncharacterized protein CMQ_5332 [Grosmannia clavigera kw1407]EFX05070.1 hypothetical protein CMQ_5332 [Grosmannia clavigera kw1407]